MKTFNVIVHDINLKKFVPYNIIPYFVSCYKERVADHTKYSDDEYFKIPKTFEEFKKFVKDEALYQFWGRCEYEIILVDWPCQKQEEKIDVYWQIMMNLDLITELLIDSINGN